MINWIVKIIVALFGLVFLLGLLVVFALFIVLASLRWLLTGKKPQFVFFLRQYGEMRKNFGQKGFQGQANPDPQAPWGRGQMTKWWMSRPEKWLKTCLNCRINGQAENSTDQKNPAWPGLLWIQ